MTVTAHRIDEGFFKGVTLYEDDELPPDTIEMHMPNGIVYRYNCRTDVLTCDEPTRVSMFGSEEMQRMIIYNIFKGIKNEAM